MPYQKILFTFIILFYCAGALASEEPGGEIAGYIDTARKNMESGKVLIEKAEALRGNKSATQDDLQLAVSFYAAAGEKFETAGNILKTVPFAIKKEYITHCRNATLYCINAIEMCKFRYNSLSGGNS